MRAARVLALVLGLGAVGAVGVAGTAAAQRAAATEWMRDHRYDAHAPPSAAAAVMAMLTLVGVGVAGVLALGAGRAAPARPRPASRGWKEADLAIVRIALEGAPARLAALAGEGRTHLDLRPLRDLAAELLRARAEWARVGGTSHKPMSEAMARGLFDQALAEEDLRGDEAQAADYRTAGARRALLVTLVVAAKRELRDFRDDSPDEAAQTLRSLKELSRKAFLTAAVRRSTVPLDALDADPSLHRVVR